MTAHALPEIAVSSRTAQRHAGAALHRAERARAQGDRRAAYDALGVAIPLLERGRPASYYRVILWLLSQPGLSAKRIKVIFKMAPSLRGTPLEVLPEQIGLLIGASEALVPLRSRARVLAGSIDDLLAHHSEEAKSARAARAAGDLQTAFGHYGAVARLRPTHVLLVESGPIVEFEFLFDLFRDLSELLRDAYVEAVAAAAPEHLEQLDEAISKRMVRRLTAAPAFAAQVATMQHLWAGRALLDAGKVDLASDRIEKGAAWWKRSSQLAEAQRGLDHLRSDLQEWRDKAYGIAADVSALSLPRARPALLAVVQRSVDQLHTETIARLQQQRPDKGDALELMRLLANIEATRRATMEVTIRGMPIR